MIDDLLFLFITICIYRPQVKHLAGPFFGEGSFTKNTDEEASAMMKQLEIWSSAETRPSKEELIEKDKKILRILPLQPTNAPIDIKK